MRSSVSWRYWQCKRSLLRPEVTSVSVLNPTVRSLLRPEAPSAPAKKAKVALASTLQPLAALGAAAQNITRKAHPAPGRARRLQKENQAAHVE